MTALVIVGLVAGLRSSRQWEASFVAAWLVVPIAGSLLVSQFKPIFYAHYLVVVIPAVAISAGWALSRIRPRGALLAAVAVVLFMSLNGLSRWYVAFDKEAWRQAAAVVAKEGRAGDVVVFWSSYVRSPFEHYVL